MRYTAQFATIGHLTVGPTANVCGRVDVGVERETALQTDKLVLGLSVSLVGVSASRTLTARIARINRYQENASQRSLIGKEGSELIERPTTQSCTLLSPNRYSFVDAFEFFNGYSTASAFGFCNDLLRNAVINISSKASFLATESFEFALGASRTAFLQLRAKASTAVANVVDLGSRQLLSVRGRGNRLYAEIHAEEIINHAWVWVWNVARRCEVELAAMVDQIGLALLRLQQFFLPFASRVTNLESSCRRPDAHRVWLEAENAGVVADCSMSGKPPLRFLVQFVGVCNFGKDVYDYLSTQRKQFFCFVVSSLWSEN